MSVRLKVDTLLYYILPPTPVLDAGEGKLYNSMISYAIGRDGWLDVYFRHSEDRRWADPAILQEHGVPRRCCSR